MLKLRRETVSSEKLILDPDSFHRSINSRVLVGIAQLKWLLRTAKDRQVSPDVALLCMGQMTEGVNE